MKFRDFIYFVVNLYWRLICFFFFDLLRIHKLPARALFEPQQWYLPNLNPFPLPHTSICSAHCLPYTPFLHPLSLTLLLSSPTFSHHFYLHPCFFTHLYLRPLFLTLLLSPPNHFYFFTPPTIFLSRFHSIFSLTPGFFRLLFISVKLIIMMIINNLINF